MEDEHGIDEKILAVPIDELSPYYDRVENYTDPPPMMRDQIEHSSAITRTSKKDVWVKGPRWVAWEDAYTLMRGAISAFIP